MNTGRNTGAVEEILQTADPDLYWTWSFILTALQIPYQTSIENDVYHLRVPEKMKTRAIREIEGYFSESNDWPPKTQNPAHTGIALQTPT